MRSVEGEVDEEGAAAVLPDEAEGGVGEDVATVTPGVDQPAVVE